VAYVGHEEGLVAEAYKDSKGIWTWALGVAATSGFNVQQYRDKPAPLVVCLRASIDYMRAHYCPLSKRRLLVMR
jgi:GH24 family phage-related lysozyme (muramidase)